MVNSIKRSVA